MSGVAVPPEKIYCFLPKGSNDACQPFGKVFLHVLEPFQPEELVGRIEMLRLVTAVSVFSFRINHHLETFPVLLEQIDQLHRLLEMHIIVSRPVGEFQHVRWLGHVDTVP